MNNKNENTSQSIRLALVYEAVNRLKDTGKIKLQKLMYFLQESFNAPTNYSFRMHHYGPYSEELETDLSRLRSSGYLSVEPDLGGMVFTFALKIHPKNRGLSLVGPTWLV